LHKSVPAERNEEATGKSASPACRIAASEFKTARSGETVKTGMNNGAPDEARPDPTIFINTRGLRPDPDMRVY
jgi:hypothetical protein